MTRNPLNTLDRNRLIARSSIAVALEASSSEKHISEMLQRFAGVLVPDFAKRCVIHVIQEDNSSYVSALNDAHDNELEHDFSNNAFDVDLPKRFITLEHSEHSNSNAEICSLLVLDSTEINHQITTSLVIPMRSRGKTLGLIVLADEQADIAPLEIATRIAALALESAQLQITQEQNKRALVRAGDNAARLRNVANLLLEANNSALLAQVVINQGFHGLGASFGTVAMLENVPGNTHQLRVLWSSGTPDCSEGILTGLRSPLIKAAHGTAIWLESRNQWVEQFPQSNTQEHNLPNSFLAVPIQLADRAIGVIAFGFLNARKFPVEARHFVLELARQCAGALERTELIQNLQTERANLEKRVIDRTHELEVRHNEMEAFVYTASHDLRTPLLAIQSLTYLMDTSITTKDEDKVRELLGRINRRIEKMGRLLEDLLTLSKVQIAQTEYEKFELSEVILSVLSDLEVQMEAVHMKVDMPKSWPQVTYTRSQAYQLILNLISNALKYAGRPGLPPRVQLSWIIHPGEQHMTLRVQDNGPGISPEQHERVFNLFHKIDANSNGTGVGLSIVKRIVERHGGQVWIETPSVSITELSSRRSVIDTLAVPNVFDLGGTTFVVTIPIAVNEALKK